MTGNNRKPEHAYRWAICYGIAVTLYVVISMLITFVIPYKSISADSDDLLIVTPAVNSPSIGGNNTPKPQSTMSPSESPADSFEPTETPFWGFTENGYYSPDFTIEITTERLYDTEVYIAEVIISDISHLKAGLANNTFGRNIAQKTSVIARNCNAIFAVNGDYYGFRDTGIVQRNSMIYRKTPRSGNGNDVLVIFNDGRLKVADEATADAVELAVNGAVHMFSFGPGLISDNEIVVDTKSEVAIHAASNPRTAIGMIEPFHYIFIVSDGRTSQSSGLSLYELALVLKDLGCTEGYNLDGGGSATMYFNGRIINKPTTNGKDIVERSVSDIVYIA